MISHKPRGRKLAPIEEVDSDLGVVEASEHMEVDERTARRVWTIDIVVRSLLKRNRVSLMEMFTKFWKSVYFFCKLILR